MPTGALRAPSHNFNAFVIESILDELAHAGRVDPVALRLSYLGEAANFPYEGDSPAPYKPERLKRVLELAAEKAGWGTRCRRGTAAARPCTTRSDRTRRKSRTSRLTPATRFASHRRRGD